VALGEVGGSSCQFVEKVGHVVTSKKQFLIFSIHYLVIVDRPLPTLLPFCRYSLLGSVVGGFGFQDLASLTDRTAGHLAFPVENIPNLLLFLIEEIVQLHVAVFLLVGEALLSREHLLLCCHVNFLVAALLLLLRREGSHNSAQTILVISVRRIAHWTELAVVVRRDDCFGNCPSRIFLSFVIYVHSRLHFYHLLVVVLFPFTSALRGDVLMTPFFGLLGFAVLAIYNLLGPFKLAQPFLSI